MRTSIWVETFENMKLRVTFFLDPKTNLEHQQYLNIIITKGSIQVLIIIIWKLWSAIVFWILILGQSVFGLICRTNWVEYRTLNRTPETFKNEIFKNYLKTLKYQIFLNFDIRTLNTLISSYKFVRNFPLFYRTFSFFLSDFFVARKSKNLFSLLSILFSFFPLLLTTFLPSFFYLSLTTYVKGKIIQTFIIMHNYGTMLVIILGDLKIYVVKLKKSENNSAPSWVGTRALVVRRLERRPLTSETIPTALRLLVTWPTAWDAPFSYEFYFEKLYCCWWNRFPKVEKQICFSKCRFYIAVYRWSLAIIKVYKATFLK